MKYLFFPIDIGIAHISRSLTLAEELQSAGHDVSIAIPKVRHPLYSKTSVRLIDIAPLSKTMDLRSMEYLLDVKKIEKFIAVEREILRKYKPDRSIVDFRFSALVSSIFEG